VLVVFDWFLRHVVEGQAEALRELGHEVLLLCRDHSLEYGGNQDERTRVMTRLRGRGVEVIELPGKRLSASGPAQVVSARRQVTRWQPDVVSAHQNSDPRLLLASRGWPTIYTVHDPVPHPGAASAKLPERLTERGWLRMSDHVVVHGTQLLTELPKGLRNGKTNTIPHGIQVADRPLPSPNQPTVLFFGRLELYKGLDVLIEAMRRLWRRRPDTRLVLAGRGPAATDVPDDSRIEFKNRYFREDEVEGLLREASLVVLPYVQASQSGVGLVSIAHGVPVVVTRAGALPELASHARYIAEPGDPVSLATVLERCLDTQESDREQVLEFARTRFSWAIVAQRYVDLYRAVLADQSGA
jgi:glycosyltransferase involved in cell wall biosynthesis